MTIEDDIEIFERIPTLRLLGREALRVLAIGAESCYVDNGEVLFRAGDPADSGFVIQEGSFRLESHGRSESREITAGPGTLLGELAMLAGTVRPATATAREPSAVIRISRGLFLKMLQNYPEAAAKLREQISTRVTVAAQDLGNVRAKLDASEAPREH